MLTKEAFNAFLKTLEEPPPHVVFVLATTEPHRMPPTILSRCQRYDFRSVPVPLLTAHLAGVAEAEGVDASEGSLRLIARRARGSARDALVILEQVISYGDGVVDESGVAGFLGLSEDEILAELGDHLVSGDAAGVIALVEKAYEEGKGLPSSRGKPGAFSPRLLLQHATSPEDWSRRGCFEAIKRQAGELLRSAPFTSSTSLREAIREMQTSTSSRLCWRGAYRYGPQRLDTPPRPFGSPGKLEGS